MRLQHAAVTRHPTPAAELQGWAVAVSNLRADRDRAEFETRKQEIAAALRRLAGSFRATR